MKWSWRIASVAGIGIYVHWTFAILILWVVLIHLSKGETLFMAVYGLVFVCAVFACVVLHELGHALTARRFGIRTRDITLLPIGGVARLQRIPEEPRQELLIAIAGPAVNVVLAAVFLVLAIVLGQLSWVADLKLVGTDLVGRLLWVNVILVLFNLLPAFPMDGGRVLRALLAQRMAYERATQVAANVGQMMAIVFGFLGFFINPFLIFIAFFVYLGAQAEAQFVQMRTAFSGAPVRDAMVTRFQSLSAAEPLTLAIDELLAGSQTDFPVVDDGRVTGMLFRNDLLKALSGEDGGKNLRVADIMRKECEVVEEGAPLDETFQRLRETGCPALPVVRGGELVGLLTTENVSEYVVVRTALRAQEQEAT